MFTLQAKAHVCTYQLSFLLTVSSIFVLIAMRDLYFAINKAVAKTPRC